MPLYKGLIKAASRHGTFQTCNVMGLDDATLVGGPPVIVKGRLEDLRRAESVIVDEVSGMTNSPMPPRRAEGPLRIGDTMELNDHRARWSALHRHPHVPVAAGHLHHLLPVPPPSPRRSESRFCSCW